MNYSKLLGVCVAFALASAPLQRVHAENILRYPLVSVADKGAGLKLTIAEKARTLATLVVTHDTSPGVVHYDPYKTGGAMHYQSVEVVMKTDSYQYVIWVENSSEEDRTQLPDALSIWEMPNDAGEVTLVSDSGLDGNCDFGMQERNGRVPLAYNSASYGFPGKGRLYRAHFQQVYERIVDELLGRYTATEIAGRMPEKP